MTTKDDLHALIDELGEAEAREALGYLRARSELPQNVSQAYVEECEAAFDEAFAPGAVLLPHAAVRAWLLAWGTSGEEAAEEELDALEQHLTKETRDTAIS
jgi:hypothetical protein